MSFGHGINPVAWGMTHSALAEVGYDDFAKAVSQTTQTTDRTQRTGFGALVPEDLSAILRKTTEEEGEFKLFQALKKEKATDVMYRWNLQNDIGGQPGAVFQQEIAAIQDSNTQIQTYIVLLKVAARLRQMSRVLKSTQAIVDFVALERRNMALEIARGQNIAGYVGDDRVAPMMPNGIRRQLEIYAPERILSLDGQSDVNEVTKAVFDQIRQVRGLGSFGKTTHLYLDLDLQNAFDTNLFPQYRVEMGDGKKTIDYGAPVTSIRSSYGQVAMENDVYIPSFANTQPYSLKPLPALAPAAASIAAVAVVPSVAGSKVTASRAGLYGIRVEGVNERFEHGAASALQTATVAVDGAIDITITPNPDGRAYGYAIQFGKKGVAAPTLADQRLMMRVPHPDPLNRTTPFTVRVRFDRIPGASTILGLNMNPNAIGFRELLPMSQVELASTDSPVIKFALIHVGAMVCYVPNHHFVIENVLPPAATWKPFD